jgi:predicted MFS family arabinose efflux permease
MTEAVVGQRAASDKASMRTIVAASSAGTAFEWYDFFIFGTLTTLITKHFFTGVPESAGFILALGAFGAGFLFRPLGALVFGRIGDRLGRKGAFLITVTLMGAATIAIGFLPTYSQAGIVAPILLILLRIVQGFALGGEYGGAAVYVAEHAPAGRRGEFTGWIQISASLGLIGAFAVILATRSIVGEAAFTAWGWRIPFLLSAGLLAISLWMRLRLHESPAFLKMQAEGTHSKAPFSEAFGQWRHLKVVLIALFGVMVAQGVVWYTSVFYAQLFLERTLKVEPVTVNYIMITVTALSAPLYLFFAWLSDKVGRKPVIVGGTLVAALVFYPAFHQITRLANPALAEATERTPVVVVADPADCSLQFDPIGRAAFTSSCDVAKSLLTNAGVSYANEAAPSGSAAVVRIGDAAIASRSGAGLSAAEFKALKAGVDAELKAGLQAAGYPLKADPERVNFWGIVAVMMVFVTGACALYGPIAACLVELFPTRIRYTAMSLPYNIGTGWVGGFVPFVAFAIVAGRGDMYSGLWYPIVGGIFSALVALFLLPETRGRDLDAG